ncbi:proline-rich proteoglycan 2-like isoform X2 [Hemicordylus capensis]|uniref:proline-rich proteoglycan 2-like isoform X2 n=1 Tax=Hemicordylus capensis TaxID=884348 RepID=UPI0023039A87|nr:proline-rich proteoglycan 2-like isoform X2 [Hemicordylus capensis]
MKLSMAVAVILASVLCTRETGAQGYYGIPGGPAFGGPAFGGPGSGGQGGPGFPNEFPSPPYPGQGSPGFPIYSNPGGSDNSNFVYGLFKRITKPLSFFGMQPLSIPGMSFWDRFFKQNQQVDPGFGGVFNPGPAPQGYPVYQPQGFPQAYPEFLPQVFPQEYPGFPLQMPAPGSPPQGPPPGSPLEWPAPGSPPQGPPPGSPLEWPAPGSPPQGPPPESPSQGPAPVSSGSPAQGPTESPQATQQAE